jgi:hypothetical protein
MVLGMGEKRLLKNPRHASSARQLSSMLPDDVYAENAYRKLVADLCSVGYTTFITLLHDIF